MQVEMGWFCAFWIKIIRLLDHYTRQHLSRYYFIWQSSNWIIYIFKKTIPLKTSTIFNEPIQFFFLPYQCKSAINTRTQTQRWLKFTHGAKFSISQLLIKIVWIRDRVEGGIKKFQQHREQNFRVQKIWIFLVLLCFSNLSVWNLTHMMMSSCCW